VPISMCGVLGLERRNIINLFTTCTKNCYLGPLWCSRPPKNPKITLILLFETSFGRNRNLKHFVSQETKLWYHAQQHGTGVWLGPQLPKIIKISFSTKRSYYFRFVENEILISVTTGRICALLAQRRLTWLAYNIVFA
jgi:hypothetical protein